MQLDIYITYFKTKIINPIKIKMSSVFETYSTYKDFNKNELDFSWVTPVKNPFISKSRLYSRYVVDILLFQKMLLSIFLAWSFYRITNKHSPYLIDILYLDITRNGCIPVKLTQWFMTRFNLISSDNSYFVDKFKNLYENCEIHDIKYTKELFKDTFGDDIQLVSDIPVASGSIAQVYKGMYKNEIVAIKVMHPDIENKIYIPKMFFMVYNIILKKLPILYKYSLPYDLDDFISAIIKQTDLSIEFDNLIRFNELYESNKLVIFPKPIVASPQILITSFEAGDYYESPTIELSEYKKYQVVLLLTLFIRDSSLINDFIHGDMHMGNWKVRQVGNDYAIVIYDVGICFSVGLDITRDFYLYWELGDRKNLAKLFRRGIKWHPNNITLDEIEEGMYTDITNITSQPINTNSIIKSILKYMNYNKIIIKHEWLNLCVGILLVEKDIKKYGILRSDKREDLNRTKRDVFKVDFLNYINFCDTHNCFNHLSTYMKECLIREKIDFSTLFTNVEYKLNLDLGDDKLEEIHLENNNVTDEPTDKIELSI
jgi:predicted unusual protein kinase regulating ubiquinone biosynthesis (AarF/ABC1/UbiB family)